MVGNLAAHVHPSPSPEWKVARAVAETEPEEVATLTLEMTSDQLEALVAQWHPARRHTPTDLVVTVGGETEAVFRVVASLIPAAPPERGKGAT